MRSNPGVYFASQPDETPPKARQGLALGVDGNHMAFSAPRLELRYGGSNRRPTPRARELDRFNSHFRELQRVRADRKIEEEATNFAPTSGPTWARQHATPWDTLQRVSSRDDLFSSTKKRLWAVPKLKVAGSNPVSRSRPRRMISTSRLRSWKSRQVSSPSTTSSARRQRGSPARKVRESAGAAKRCRGPKNLE